MKCVDLTVYVGPNLHSRHPLARLELDGESAQPLDRSALAERLEALWPESGIWNAMAQGLKRLAEGPDTLHWAQAVGCLTNFALDLEPRPQLRHWHEPGAGDDPRFATVYVELSRPFAGREAARFALEVTGALFAETALREGQRLESEIRRSMARMARRRNFKDYNNITRLLVDSAKARGVPVTPYFADSEIAVMGHGRHRRRMKECFGDTTSVLAGLIARDKVFTTGLLRANGVPVPKQRLVESKGALARAIEDIGFPLVIKGRSGSKGAQVTANIRAHDEIPEAVKKAQEGGQDVLVESHVEGEDYRLTVIDGKLFAAVRRVPAHVTGDGRQSVAELIAEENRRRAEWDNPYASWVQRLILDDDMLAMLARQQLTPESVPPAGVEVRLRAAGNFSLGGTAEDVTDLLHPSVVATVERAARALRLDMAGVDLLSPDITAPIDSVRCAINEVNSFPSPRAHYITPTPPRDVAGAVIDYLFPPEHRGRIPTAALLCKEAPAVATLLRRMLGTAGMTTGSACREGLYLGDARLCDARDLGIRDTATILQDPAAEAAILQVWPAQVVTQGLAWDACDTAVIDGSVIEAQAGNEGLGPLLLSLTDKALVLQAASRACRALARQRSGQEAIWLAGGEQSVALAETAAEQDRVLVLQQDSGQAVLQTPSGRTLDRFVLARHSHGREATAALMAIGAALTLGIDSQAIEEALRWPAPPAQTSPLGGETRNTPRQAANG